MRGIGVVFDLKKFIATCCPSVYFIFCCTAAFILLSARAPSTEASTNTDAPTNTEAPNKLTFGLYADENPIVIVSKFRPILDEIERQFSLRYKKNVSIKMDITRTYQQGINHLVSGRFDFARFGAASYIIAKARDSNIEVIAVENYKGKNHFKGLVFVHLESSINKVDDLKNRSFAFGGLNSTIGRYLPQQWLYQAGLFSKDLSHFDYLGRHDDVLLAVSTGGYDAGAVKESTFKRLKKQGHTLRVIHEFKVPTKPWISSAKIAPILKQQLQSILMEYRNSESLNKLGKQGFLIPDPRVYADIDAAINNNLRFFSHDSL